MEKYQRIEFIKNLIYGKVLDIGCNQGILHGELLKTNKDVWGFDKEITRYKKKIIRGDAHKLKVKNRFDVIVAGEIIEHLEKPTVFLQECFRILKKNGRLILTTPNKDSWLNKLTKSYYHSEHKKIFNETEMRKMLKKTNFQIRMFKYLPYDVDSVGGNRISRFIYLRRFLHFLVPEKNRENMFVVCEKL